MSLTLSEEPVDPLGDGPGVRFYLPLERTLTPHMSPGPFVPLRFLTFLIAKMRTFRDLTHRRLWVSSPPLPCIRTTTTDSIQSHTDPRWILWTHSGPGGDESRDGVGETEPFPVSGVPPEFPGARDRSDVWGR